MDCTALSVPYQEITQFSRIVIDYLNGSPQLKSFFKYPVSAEGIGQAIEARKLFKTDRVLLTEVLSEQYAAINTSKAVKINIRHLAEENTYTFVTAHQPNIFTGYLYLVYKILHVIKLAEFSSAQFPGNRFVPVFYMGSEDADLDELGKIFIDGEKIVWETDQTGAVGRMNTKGLDKIISKIEGQLGVFSHGPALVSLLKECYSPGNDIKTATFTLLNTLFQEYGLVILIPDNAKLKKSMHHVFEDDLLHQAPSAIVEGTISRLPAYYKVQANPREINLFYLKDNTRGRIIRSGDQWKVVGKEIRFSEAELKRELREHPERFSPNVILRGLFQESILPNIGFIGGGGETAYWLELKDLFDHYKIPFPVLVMRNSFLFVEKKLHEKISRLGFSLTDMFKDENLLMNDLVKRKSGLQLHLDREISDITNLYGHIKGVALQTDPTLDIHVEALKTKAVAQLQKLEKKMLKAEKRKFEAQQRQVHAIRKKLFPGNGLQERVDNFMPYYAKFGPAFIQMLYKHSPAHEQEFVVLAEL